MKIYILIPIFNDWDSVSELLKNIDIEIKNLNHEVSVIIINDASTEIKEINTLTLKNINSAEIVNMTKNQGHSRCIASGLKYIFKEKDFDYVIPMDGDGEDRPEEIIDFIQLADHSENKTIIGERIKRSEGFFFKLCYQFHKYLTLAFTGESIKFGNFTCLSKSTIEKMLNEKATWNSFSGSLKKIESDLFSIPSVRGHRYFGPSKMSFINLIKHSLAIISVFRKTFLIRSAFFIIIYILMIKSNASIITAMPLIFLLIAVYSVSNLALRENMEEFKNCLSQIKNIENIK